MQDAHGPQHWWPADGPFEVMVGAVLTQNTSWSNVERALARLRARVAIEPESILALDPPELAELLRPVGYFNVKSRRLRSFCEAYLAAGGLSALCAVETPALRRWLLEIPGVGPETADDILLYAFDRPVFVVDAYTRRLFGRLGVLDGAESYDDISRIFAEALDADQDRFGEYHALIVQHGKRLCRTRPVCGDCVLSQECPSCAVR